MKIEYEKGNFVTTDIRLIAHGCNAQGVMGAGAAKAIRDRFPAAYTQYKKMKDAYGLYLGDVIPVTIGDKVILNCITQEFYGRDPSKRYVNYAAIAKCFSFINTMFRATDTYVAMPKIGANLGGGDWNVIEQIIEDAFVNIIPIVYVLEENS